MAAWAFSFPQMAPILISNVYLCEFLFVVNLSTICFRVATLRTQRGGAGFGVMFKAKRPLNNEVAQLYNNQLQDACWSGELRSISRMYSMLANEAEEQF